ncbi:unnamed protein product [Closterium sp. NIES-54]
MECSAPLPAAVQADGECWPGNVPCLGGMGCVRADKQCDGVFDCDDGSDDGYDVCLSYDCSNVGKMWYRKGYQCRALNSFCDLNYDCTDSNDEEPERCYHIYRIKDLCKPKGLVQCPNDPGYCIGPQDVCDKILQCSSLHLLSSHPHPLQVQCPNDPGYCIGPQEVCDSISQCSDGWDELNCFNHTCQPGQIHCPLTGYCAKGRLCDGTQDCWGGMGIEDENPEFCEGYVCPEGWWKCADGLQCVEASRWCDGAVNCLDGSDEGAVCVVATPLPPPPPAAGNGSGGASGDGSGASNSSSASVVLSKEEIAKLKKLAQEKKAAAVAAKKQKMEAKRAAEEEKTKQRAAKKASIEAKIRKAAMEAKKKQQAEKEAAIAEKKRKRAEKAAAIEAKKKQAAAIEAKKKQAEKAAAVAAKNKATTK